MIPKNTIMEAKAKSIQTVELNIQGYINGKKGGTFKSEIHKSASVIE